MHISHPISQSSIPFWNKVDSSSSQFRLLAPASKVPANRWHTIDPSSNQFQLPQSSFQILDKVPEIPQLTDKLSKVENILRVQAVAPREDDLHWIEFEMELQPENELPDNIWDKVQDRVIDYEWKLRDETNEKWYFHVHVVRSFSRLQPGSRVVASSYIQAVEARPKILASYTHYQVV
jgi:hypothetical protein